MLARIVRDADTHNLTWERISGDAGSAGATPLGSVLAYFGTTVPEGFLPCNGATYDVTQYPELYAFLNSSTLPDLRECALVGIGENSTDTLGTHDIFTLGQFKDSGTYGTNTTSWEALHPYDAATNVMTTVINTTGAEQIVTAKTGTSTATLGMRTRSKGVNWIIKAIPGMETTEVTDAIEAINEKLAKALVTKDVLALPTGAGIEGYLYHYQGHYYIPHIDAESPAQSYLTELANISDIQPVIEWFASADPLPTGSAIKEHLYAQEYTTAGGDTKYHYYIGKVDSSDPLNNELVALETGAGASIFIGTQAEWDALSTAEKNEYQQADLTDVNSVVHVPVDTVADGNMNPVTSNAVYDALNTVETGAISLDTSVWNVNIYSTIRKSGHTVVVNARLWKEEAIVTPNNVIIGTIPVGFRPSTDTYYVTSHFSLNHEQLLICFHPDGNITTAGAGFTPSRTDIYINCSWVI